MCRPHSKNSLAIINNSGHLKLYTEIEEIAAVIVVEESELSRRVQGVVLSTDSILTVDNDETFLYSSNLYSCNRVYMDMRAYTC